MKKTIVEKHFDKIAEDYDVYTQKRNLHYSTLKDLLKKLIGDGKKVLEVGCGTGDLLFSITPQKGYGLDISSKMINKANSKYGAERNLTFSTKWPTGSFDYVFMSDVVEHLENRYDTFTKIAHLMGPKSLFINTMMNPIWEPVEKFYEFMNWKMPEGPHERVNYSELKFEVEKADLRIVKHDYSLLVPISIPFITNFANKYLEKYIRRFAFIEYLVAVRS